MSRTKYQPRKPREISQGDGMRSAWFNSHTGMPCVDAWHMTAPQCRRFAAWLLRVAEWIEKDGGQR